jgi:hypothetical protein
MTIQEEWRSERARSAREARDERRSGRSEIRTVVITIIRHGT